VRRFLFIVALVLAGCQTTGTTVGSGPITLSSTVQAHFDDYMSSNGSMFAVATDGASGAFYYYCPDIACRITNGARQKSIERCEKISRGIPCKIYAVKKQIVWNFDAAPQSDSGTKSVVTTNPTSTDIRQMNIRWTGAEGIISSTIDLNDSKSRISLNQYVGCYVTHSYTLDGRNGTWTLSCTNGKYAEGKFKSKGKGDEITGQGYDSNGNTISYKIFARTST